MSDTGWIVVGIIALVCIVVFRRELGSLLDRTTGLEVGPDGVKIKAAKTPLGKTMGVLAVALAAVNVFGGFLVTRRMLEMFRKKEKKTPAIEGAAK